MSRVCNAGAAGETTVGGHRAAPERRNQRQLGSTSGAETPEGAAAAQEDRPYLQDAKDICCRHAVGRDETPGLAETHAPTETATGALITNSDTRRHAGGCGTNGSGH